MNKQQFVDKLAAETRNIDPNITKKSLKAIVDAAFSTMLEGIKEDGRFSVPTLGTFKLKQQKARTSRNPHTGVPVAVPAKCTISFKPATKVKEEVTKDCLK